MKFTLVSSMFASGTEVQTRWERYSNNDRPALLLTTAGPYAQPLMTATVNLVGEYLDDDETAVKDYGANEGILEDLVRAGLVKPPHRFVYGKHVTFPICRWTRTAQADRVELAPARSKS